MPCQCWGQATAAETEAAAGAHNNQPTNGSGMAAETTFSATLLAPVAAVASAVAMAAMAEMPATAEAQTVGNGGSGDGGA